MTAVQTPGRVIVAPHHRAAAWTGLARPLAARRLLRAVRHRSRVEGRALSIVLVGAPAGVRYVLRRAEKTSGAACTVVGVVLDGAVATGDVTRDWGDAHRALCYVGIEEVDAAVRDLGADAVVVADPLPGGSQYLRVPGLGAY